VTTDGNEWEKTKKNVIIISLIVLVLIAVGLVIFLGSKKDVITPVQVEKVTPRTLTQLPLPRARFSRRCR